MTSQFEPFLQHTGAQHRHQHLAQALDDVVVQERRAAVAARQAELFARREACDSQRLAPILGFAGASGCITRRLLAYFGEPLADENCGHCHFCRTGEPATPIAPFTEADSGEIRALLREGHPSLANPRAVTRLLCGLTSPATARAKLTKRREFGRHASTPFRTVLAHVEACWG